MGILEIIGVIALVLFFLRPILNIMFFFLLLIVSFPLFFLCLFLGVAVFFALLPLALKCLGAFFLFFLCARLLKLVFTKKITEEPTIIIIKEEK